jgi:transcription elongation GreA/GreB family factor
MLSTKQQLHELCISKIQEQIKTLQEAMDAARASGNEETKSSAGDKYETGRAMMQLEVEKNSSQLQEATKLKNVLERIRPEVVFPSAQTGSLLITNQGNFYLSVSAGAFTIDNQVYQTLSTSSPLGAKMVGLKAGAVFVFQTKNFTIERID